MNRALALRLAAFQKRRKLIASRRRKTLGAWHPPGTPWPWQRLTDAP